MQIFLKLSGHPKANIKRIALSRNTVVGRSKSCGLRIDSSGVSRKHCEIRVGEESASVVDLGSSNGTFVADERIAAGEEHPLDEGVRLNIGGIRFLVSYISPRAAQAASADDELSAAISAAAVGESAAETPPAASESRSEDEPLPLDDDDDLIGLADEPQPAQQEPAAERDAPLSEDAPLDEDAPLAADESSNVPSGELAPEGAIIPDDDDIPLLEDDESYSATDGESSAGEQIREMSGDDELLESETQSNGTDTDTEALDGQDGGQDERDGADIEGDLVGDIESDEPILVADEADLLDGDAPSESDVNLDDSATIYSGESLGEDDEVQEFGESGVVEESAAEDEPLLDVDDEDQAFAFLDDDEADGNKKATKSGAGDSKLGDFLNQFGQS